MTAADRDPVVELDHVSVERGGRVVLRDIGVVLPSSRVFGLIGPSGCGKTTLMRTIVGIQAKVEGAVVVLGRPAGEASRLGQVGYMTQDPSVYDDLTVRENLTYFGRVLGVGMGRVDEVLVSAHLGDTENALVANLSGGQRARVSLAIALLNQPPLLVLDEPTVGVDPVLRHELWSTFADLARGGSTLIVSSHVMEEANRCDELLLMHEGQILATGSPSQLMMATGADDLDAAFLELIGKEASR